MVFASFKAIHAPMPILLKPPQSLNETLIHASTKQKTPKNAYLIHDHGGMVLTTFYIKKDERRVRGGCKDRKTTNPIGRLGVGSPAVSVTSENSQPPTLLQKINRLLGEEGMGRKTHPSLRSSLFSVPLFPFIVNLIEGKLYSHPNGPHDSLLIFNIFK